MEPGRTLIDTSAWIETFRSDGDARMRSVVTDLTEAQSAVLCDMVLLELWNGARGVSEAKALRRLERDVETVPTTSAVWLAASELSRTCRQKGVSVPASDLLIAACAQVHNLECCTPTPISI